MTSLGSRAISLNSSPRMVTPLLSKSPSTIPASRGPSSSRGADLVIECAGVPQAVPEALEMLRMSGMLVEAGNFSDLGEIPISPHRHLCAKNVRILGVSGEEPAAYGPGMRQMARYMKHYPLREFVTHRFGLRDVEAAVEKSIETESMKVVLEPWR